MRNTTSGSLFSTTTASQKTKAKAKAKAKEKKKKKKKKKNTHTTTSLPCLIPCRLRKILSNDDREVEEPEPAAMRVVLKLAKMRSTKTVTKRCSKLYRLRRGLPLVF